VSKLRYPAFMCSLGFLVPRVLVKFVSTSFASQDVDIVRYMWVKGNLKDSLGIRRRNKEIVVVDGSSSDPEGTPMFREPHTRSISEISSPDVYEPGFPRGLGDHTPINRIEALDTTTPQISAPLIALSSSLHGPLTPMVTTGEDNAMMSTPTPPAMAIRAAAMPPSPQPSYYSASDVPLPSPVPSPGSSYEPSQVYPRAPSISYSRPLRGQYPSHSDNLCMPPNSYEMQVHSPKLEESSSPMERREWSENNEVARASILSTTDDGPMAL